MINGFWCCSRAYAIERPCATLWNQCSLTFASSATRRHAVTFTPYATGRIPVMRAVRSSILPSNVL
jgi:hypothetical protein